MHPRRLSASGGVTEHCHPDARVRVRRSGGARDLPPRRAMRRPREAHHQAHDTDQLLPRRGRASSERPRHGAGAPKPADGGHAETQAGAAPADIPQPRPVSDPEDAGSPQHNRPTTQGVRRGARQPPETDVRAGAHQAKVGNGPYVPRAQPAVQTTPLHQRGGEADLHTQPAHDELRDGRRRAVSGHVYPTPSHAGRRRARRNLLAGPGKLHPHLRRDASRPPEPDPLSAGGDDGAALLRVLPAPAHAG